MASRSRSRSPLRHNNVSLPASDRMSLAQSDTSVTTPTSNIIDKNKRTFPCAKETEFKLKLNNIPQTWMWQQVSEYIKKHTTHIHKDIHEDIMYISLKPDPVMPKLQESFISFKTENLFNQAYLALKQTWDKVEGNKLFVQKDPPGSKSARSIERIMRFQQLHQTKSKAFSQNDASSDENETYGLSAKYLHDLGITVRPLSRKVYVRNLPEQYSDEAKVRSAFSLAGTLVLVQLLPKKKNVFNARLEYDHPIEAVQAVSMFNNKELYGSIIKCEMDKLTKNVCIDGMPMRGPGLGPDGSPMRGVRVAVEIKKAKPEFMSNFQIIEDTLDDLQGHLTNINMQVESYKAQLNFAPPIQNVPNPVQNVANPLQNVANPLAALRRSLLIHQDQVLHGLLQRNIEIDMRDLLKKIYSKSLLQGQSNNQIGTVQCGPNNMPGSFNMQSDPASNIQRGPNNIQFGPNNMRPGSYGPSNNQRGPHMQPDRQNMQHGNPRPFMQGPKNNPGYNGQPSQLSGFANMQSGYPNMQPQSGPGQNPQTNADFGVPPYNNNMDRQDSARTGSKMLLFRNLPPTVTLPALHGKMREVGEVSLVEMTGPGRALISFYTDHDADKCIRLFNHSNVDGQTIEVRKV